MGTQVESATRVAATRPPARDRSVALILSDEPTAGLGGLTVHRCKAALPFGGKYRLVDFALSNCANSGIGTVGVITQYRPRSLHAHLDYGRPWDLDRCGGGLALLHPYQARAGIGWYTGSADAIYQNLDFVLRTLSDHVVVLSGCEMYCIDLGRLIARHREANADLTICAVDVAEGQQGALVTDRQGWVRHLVSPGSGAPGLLSAMGVMVFSADVLCRRVHEDAEESSSTHDLVRDVIPRIVEDGDRVLAFHHAGYWSGLNTVHEYWQANMSLLSQGPRLLDNPSWPIRTRPEIRSPARISERARVSDSLVSEGCVIEGTVERAILSPGVRVAPGAVVRDAVLMHDTLVEEVATVVNAVVDRDVIVGPSGCIGRASRERWPFGASTYGHITVVEKGARIAAGEAVDAGAWDHDWLCVALTNGSSNQRLVAA